MAAAALPLLLLLLLGGAGAARSPPSCQKLRRMSSMMSRVRVYWEKMSIFAPSACAWRQSSTRACSLPEVAHSRSGLGRALRLQASESREEAASASSSSSASSACWALRGGSWLPGTHSSGGASSDTRAALPPLPCAAAAAAAAALSLALFLTSR